MKEKQNPVGETRRRLKREYGELFEAMSATLFRHDPISINFGNNKDEYDSEAGTILPRLKVCRSAEEVREVVHEEFVRWFSPEDAGSEERYDQIAKEIWVLWQKSNVTKTISGD